MEKNKLSDENNEIREELLGIYPDKKVHNLSKKDKTLYHRIYFLSKKSGISVRDYVKSLGFEYYSVARLNEVDNRTKERLARLYPDGVVSGLRKDHYSFSQMLFAIAKKRGMTQKDYIESIGFQFIDGRVVSVDELKGKIISAYPNKVVTKISRENQGLYQLIGMIAKKEKKEIADFLSELGFTYVDGRYKEELKNLKEQIANLYPDGNVVSLFRKHHSIYIKAFRMAKEKGMTVDKYLEELGFNYATSKNKDIEKQNDEIKSELLTKYPKMVVRNLSSKERLIYQKVKRVADRQNKTVEQFVLELGFKYIGSRNVGE